MKAPNLRHFVNNSCVTCVSLKVEYDRMDLVMGFVCERYGVRVPDHEIYETICDDWEKLDD